MPPNGRHLVGGLQHVIHMADFPLCGLLPRARPVVGWDRSPINLYVALDWIRHGVGMAASLAMGQPDNTV